MDIACDECGRKGIKVIADNAPFATHSYDEEGVLYHHEPQFAKPEAFEVRCVYCKAENEATGWLVQRTGDKNRLAPA